VTDQLSGLGFEIFMPKVLAWRRHNGARRRLEQPLFPGYVFVHHAIDRESHVTILKARGVVRVLGDGWDRLAVIPAAEIDVVQQMVASGSPVSAHRQLAKGDRVRVVAGPLTGVVGVFQRSRPSKGLLLASITLLQQSVAVEVDAAAVEPL
jgi:transcription antitermination factor NusG